nr:hypothetical protein [Tanacetum cinerariifolium]
TMDMTIDQQVALDEALVPHVFLVTADVPKIYMHELWATAIVHHHSIRSKMDNKKRIVNLEYFREMLHICPRLPLQTFDEFSFEEEILAFLRFLGHSGEIRKLTDGIYHKKNVDFAYLPWEDFVYQVEHMDAKKSNEMYYPRFTKVIIYYFKDPSIPRRNKVNWHYAKDDQMFTTIKLKEYYAVASGAAPPKTKASVKKTKSSSNTTITPPTAAGTRLLTSAKGKQPAKSSKAKDEGTGIIPRVPDVPTDESDEEISWKSSDEDDDEVDERSDDQDDDDDQDTDNDGNDDASLGLNVGSKEGENAEDDDDKLYRGVNINLEGIDSLFETTPRVDVQASATITPLTLTAPTLPPPTITTISQVPQAPTPPTTAPSTFLQDLPNFGSLFEFNQRLKTLEANFSEYMDQRMNEAVNVVVQIQSNRLQDETQAENEEFLNNLDENIQKIIKEQVKEQQYPHNLLKPLPLIPNSRGRRVILLDHFINNDLEYLRGGASSRKYTTSVTKTKAADYGHIKWIKDLFYMFAVNRESTRYVYLKHRIIAVIELQIVEWHNYKHLDWITNALISTSLRMFTRSIVIQRRMEDLQLGFESYQKKLNLTNPDTYRSDLKHKEAYTAYSDQPITEPSQHPEWFSQQKKPPTLDRDWNKTLLATYESIQPESIRDVYSKRRIIAVTELKIVEWHNYKHLDWITVRRDDDKLYKFKECDFKRLRIQDIKDMLLLMVLGKLINLTVEERFAFNVSLRMFTRSIVIQRRLEDLQLGVESYQKKLNLTRPDTDGKLTDVRTALDDRLKALTETS